MFLGIEQNELDSIHKREKKSQTKFRNSATSDSSTSARSVKVR